MMTIYGLRAKGHCEFRYIGRSGKPLELRLRKHILNARRNYPPKISAWIRRAGEIEIVPIIDCPDDEAAAAERAIVERYHGLAHQLTNSHLLPRSKRAA